MTKKKIKIRYVVLLMLFVILLTPFVLWKLTANKYLDIVVFNKTFPIETLDSGEVASLDYSKQRGLFWLMDYLGIKQQETRKSYNGEKDYYGNFLSEGKLVNKPLQKLSSVPDVIYISDMYGTGNSRVNGLEPVGVSGMTKEEVGIIATSYERGTTVIGEYNIAGDPTKASVSKELEAIFGVQYTGLAGKFFSDLSSTADVPNWIRVTYEQQYGKKWSMTGAGIVIAGNNRIVVLQRNVGFIGPSLQVNMSEENANTYGTKTVNYYNWFEIVKPVDQESVIAWYDLNLTEEGENQLKPFGLNHRFPAIIANHENDKRSFYLAGDFTDYRGPDKIKQFLGATTLYRYFSVNSEGDTSYFYWNFYTPFMSKVLKDVKPLDHMISFKNETEVASDGSQLVSKITDRQFSVYRNGDWNKMYVKGVDIGPTVPGVPDGILPDDPAFYRDWFEKIGAMNANTIRVYTLMPPVFYRALDVYNFNNPDKKLYLLQNISVNQEPPAGNYSNIEYNLSFKKAIEKTINAIHGNVTVNSPDKDDSESYMNDVSGSVLGYLIDPNLNPDYVAITNEGNTMIEYKGEYVSIEANATQTEAWLASIIDNVYQYEQKNYDMQHPIALVSTPELDGLYQKMNDYVVSKAGVVLDINHFDVSNKVTSGFFGAYDIFPDQLVFKEDDREDEVPSLKGFKEYLNAFVKAQNKYPILISEFGIPTSNGSTEKVQGQGIVSMYSIIKESGAMGGLVYEWADEWGKSNQFTSPYMIPYNRGMLWHNIVDPAQNFGILAMESKAPKDYSMTLRGSDPLNTLALNADETYFYLKAEFSKIPDFNKKSIMIYLDTIDRKNGEYMLAPDVNENWSGAEFNIQIINPTKADLLVIPSYNTSKGTYFTSISTTGIFERMTRQVSSEYETKADKRVKAKYEDVSAIASGSFESNTNGFYVEGNTLSVRIPWSKLNFTDPSSLLVLNDEKSKGVIENKKDALTVRMTDGIVASLVVMNKETKQVDYHFPESVTSSGYKTFTWNTWDIPQYVQRTKSSYDMIKAAFAE